jgi:predicted SAM-dependent methyltransferase
MAHFLEHVTDPIQIIQKAKKLLKKGGILIVRVPNINCLSFKIFKNYYYNLDLPRHLFMFSPKTLDNVLNLSGFEKNEIKLNKINSDFISILNFLGFGYIRSKVVTSFVNRLILFTLGLFPSFLLWLIFLPFYIFYEGEEIVSISTN